MKLLFVKYYIIIRDHHKAAQNNHIDKHTTL